MNASRLMLICGVTVAVNETWAIRNGRDAATPLVSGAIGFVILSVVGGIWRWDIVTAIAGVFLLSALIRHGIPLGQDLTTLASGKGVGKTTATPKGTPVPKAHGATAN